MALFWKKKQFWGAVIGLALLAYCVKDIRFSELDVLLERVSFYYVIPAVVSGFLFMVFRGLRWRTMISQQKGLHVPRAVTLYSAGQVLSIVMPILTGQVGRVFLFSRKEGLGKTFVFSTIVLEVLFDAISLIVFMFVTSLAFAFPSEYRSLSFIVAGVTVAALISLYLILHYQQSLEQMGRRHLRGRWPGIYITVKKFIRSFTKGIEMLRSSQHLFASLAYSLLQWLAHILTIYLLMRSFGFGLNFATAIAVMIINQLAVMIPITPGNAGTFEVVVSTSLAAFSVSRSDAVLFAIGLHILDLLPVFIMGYIFLHMEKVSITEIKAQHEDEYILDRVSEEGTLVDNEEKV